MLNIEIDSPDVDVRSGTSKNGQPYSIRNQNAWLHNGKKYPTEFKVRLQDGQVAYPVGKYTVDPSSFYVDQYGSLSLRTVLQPVKA